MALGIREMGVFRTVRSLGSSEYQCYLLVSTYRAFMPWKDIHELPVQYCETPAMLAHGVDSN